MTSPPNRSDERLHPKDSPLNESTLSPETFALDFSRAVEDRITKPKITKRVHPWRKDTDLMVKRRKAMD